MSTDGWSEIADLSPVSSRAHRVPRISRRAMLAGGGMGLGMLGLAGLLPRSQQPGSTARNTPTVHGNALPESRLPVRAKSVIWLFMYGGPSAVDLFDPKPALTAAHGKPLEGKGKVDPFFGKPGPLMKSPFAFRQHGQSGAWVSELFPALSGCIDDLAFLRACTAASNNHAPALYQMNSGTTRVGFPSAGSWVTYGLGSESQDLPGFVVMYDRRGVPVGGPALWGSGFLPGAHQGTLLRGGEQPILNLAAPQTVKRSTQRAQLDLMAQLNEEHQRLHPAEEALESRIASFELAYRMQMEAPEALEIRSESAATHRLYGLDRNQTRDYGTQLLLARRMVERGVRFIQVYSGGPGGEWDAHIQLTESHRERCRETDVPIAGLLTDLKQRGLLDETLIVWGGEFGRLPISQGGDGRDHNPHGFLTWMAGGGVKGGTSYGETDELGYRAAVDPVSVHDLHATILHQLGLDHTRLTYRHQGRDFRLTDVAGNVIEPILA